MKVAIRRIIMNVDLEKLAAAVAAATVREVMKVAQAEPPPTTTAPDTKNDQVARRLASVVGSTSPLWVCFQDLVSGKPGNYDLAAIQSDYAKVKSGVVTGKYKEAFTQADLDVVRNVVNEGFKGQLKLASESFGKTSVSSKETSSVDRLIKSANKLIERHIKR
jgi:hypothetical protein